MQVKGFNLLMPRGDTAGLWVDVSQMEISLEEGDKVYFTVKESTLKTEKLLQKIVTVFEDGKAHIVINPADTKDLAFGTYVYDIQITFGSGMVKTITPTKPTALFTILPEVTYE